MAYTLAKTNKEALRNWFRLLQTAIDTWNQEDPASRLLAATMFVFALYTVLLMAIIQRRGYSALPWGDMWDYWIWYLRPHPGLFLKLFELHNEHRIAVARLFFLVDQKLFQGRAVFIFICIFLIQFFHGILLCRLAHLAYPFRKSSSLFLGSAAFLCLFSALQYSNFTWSFQIQFVAVYFAVTGALAALMRVAKLIEDGSLLTEQRKWIWLGFTIFLGIIATYSMANGLLIWPLLVLEACWFGLPRRLKLVLFAAWAAMWPLYLWGYRTPPQTSSIREGFHRLPQSFAFAMCVLGSPLNGLLGEIRQIFWVVGDNWRLLWTATAGLVGVMAAALLCIIFVRRYREMNRAETVILHLLLFLIATAVLIGLGRANAPLEGAVHSRYTTPALLFWFCLLFLFSSFVVKSLQEDYLPIFQLAAFFALLLIIILYQPTMLVFARSNALELSEYESTIGAPVFDRGLWSKSYYNPRALIPVLRFMQANHLSIFAPVRLRWIGDALTDHYQIVSQSNCTGLIDLNPQVFADSELPGFRVDGWAVDASNKFANAVVLTGRDGRILNFGYTGFDRPDVRATRAEISPGVGWTAYIPGLNGKYAAAYMITRDGRGVCPVGTRDMTPFPEVPLQRLGDELPEVDSEIEGGWRKGGYPNPALPPPKTTVFSSWINGDWDIGTIRLGPFPTENSDAIALPLLTGADSKGLSITVLDTQTERIVAKLSPPPALGSWRAWKVLLPRYQMELEIIAEDKGTQSGEWLALGLPRKIH